MSGSSSDRQQQEGELRVSDVSGHTAPLFRQREDVFLSPVFVRVLVFFFCIFFTAAHCNREQEQSEPLVVTV